MVSEVETCKIRSFKNYTDFLEKLKIDFHDKYDNDVPSTDSNLHEYEKLNVIGRGTYGVVVNTHLIYKFLNFELPANTSALDFCLYLHFIITTIRRFIVIENREILSPANGF